MCIAYERVCRNCLWRRRQRQQQHQHQHHQQKYICQLVNTHTICSIFILNFINFSFAATAAATLAAIIEHRTFNLLFFCSVVYVRCASLSPNYRMSATSMHWMRLCMYLVRFYAVQSLMHYMHLFRFSLVYLNHVVHVSAMYDCAFNERICTNHSNWACYTLPFFSLSSSHIAVSFSHFLVRIVCLFIYLLFSFVIKICNTHLIWRNFNDVHWFHFICISFWFFQLSAMSGEWILESILVPHPQIMSLIEIRWNWFTPEWDFFADYSDEIFENRQNIWPTT